jgi:hypothetical protein
VNETVKAEIRELALGYCLTDGSNPHLMASYLTPAYFRLRRQHAGLNFAEFIEELVKVRELARKTAATA